MSAWTPLPWHEARWAQLRATIADGRLAHALLFAGPRGVGKRHFAHGLAGYLLCEAQAPAGRPCGACRSCVQIAAGVHPNLMKLAPAEDKRDIAIDDIRDLLDRLHLSSHYGQAKVAIVEPADALNASGVNALLKTIEEPPAATHVLLVAERWRTLPPTLRSRCQILRFGPPPADQALAWLKQRHPQLPESALRPLLRSPLLEQPLADADYAETRAEWGRALADALDGRLSLKLAQGLKRDTAQAGLEIWLQAGTVWLERLLAPGRPGAGGTPRGATSTALQHLLTDTLDALRALERNGNPTLLVESIMIRLAQRAAASR